jgi:hypothetical protein
MLDKTKDVTNWITVLRQDEMSEGIPVLDIAVYHFPVYFRLKKGNHFNGYFCKYNLFTSAEQL